MTTDKVRPDKRPGYLKNEVLQHIIREDTTREMVAGDKGNKEY